MDTKEIKTHITQLEKATDDKTILQILTILKKDIKPTEKLLRVCIYFFFLLKLISDTNKYERKPKLV